jgi:hypothetical protein
MYFFLLLINGDCLLIAYNSLQSWAKREAKKRLEERGEDLTYPMTKKLNENAE